MATKFCPECGYKIIVHNYTAFNICPNCKKCIKPITIISTKESLKDIEPFFTYEKLQQIKNLLKEETK
jgi:hypothetical protein